jgi:hypothetical protein
MTDCLYMALRLVSLLFSLVLVGVLAATMKSRLHSTQKDGVATPTNLLQQAGAIVDRSHQITGTYSGISAQPDSPLRLVSADASGYCLQLTWLNRPYHLRGPGGQPAEGAC